MKNDTLTLTTLFATATEPMNADHHASVELGLILLSDPLALRDLVRTLFAGNTLDTSSRAGIQRILQILYAYGVVEDIRDKNGHPYRLRFRAQPLLHMLRQMPDRDPLTGLPKQLSTQPSA